MDRRLDHVEKSVGGFGSSIGWSGTVCMATRCVTNLVRMIGEGGSGRKLQG